jgi:hypothetical protein
VSKLLLRSHPGLSKGHLLLHLLLWLYLLLHLLLWLHLLLHLQGHWLSRQT